MVKSSHRVEGVRNVTPACIKALASLSVSRIAVAEAHDYVSVREFSYNGQSAILFRCKRDEPQPRIGNHALPFADVIELTNVFRWLGAGMIPADEGPFEM